MVDGVEEAGGGGGAHQPMQQETRIAAEQEPIQSGQLRIKVEAGVGQNALLERVEGGQQQ